METIYKSGSLLLDPEKTQEKQKNANVKNTKREMFFELTKTSLGLGMAAIILAATISFSQVLAKLIMCIPSLFRLYMYGAIKLEQFSVPRWAYSVLKMQDLVH